MPWKDETPMDQRYQFIQEYSLSNESFSWLCSKYGISRRTGYKWVERFDEEGRNGLADRSRKPHRSPNQTAEEIEDALVAVRRKHSSWGGGTLLWMVEQQHPDWELPGRSTVCDILRRHDLVRTKRRRRRPGHAGKPTTVIDRPNAVWSADFKGQFRLGNGRYCYPLTMTDNFSRYLLCCEGLWSTNLDDTKAVMTRVFREYGLPSRIRTDNGVPFASEALGRLSRLSAWWIRLGITPEFIEPGKPQQNGRHERMHRTLKGATTHPVGQSLGAQQRKFNRFLREFNFERPHQALGMSVPSSVYQASDRDFIRNPPALEYPPNFERRFVSENGGIRWNKDWVNVSTVCAGEHVGLEEIDDGIWNVYYGHFKLGIFHERHMRIEDAHGRLRRK